MRFTNLVGLVMLNVKLYHSLVRIFYAAPGWTKLTTLQSLTLFVTKLLVSAEALLLFLGVRQCTPFQTLSAALVSSLISSFLVAIGRHLFFFANVRGEVKAAYQIHKRQREHPLDRGLKSQVDLLAEATAQVAGRAARRASCALNLSAFSGGRRTADSGWTRATGTSGERSTAGSRNTPASLSGSGGGSSRTIGGFSNGSSRLTSIAGSPRLTDGSSRLPSVAGSPRLTGSSRFTGDIFPSPRGASRRAAQARLLHAGIDEDAPTRLSEGTERERGSVSRSVSQSVLMLSGGAHDRRLRKQTAGCSAATRPKPMLSARCARCPRRRLEWPTSCASTRPAAARSTPQRSSQSAPMPTVHAVKDLGSSEDDPNRLSAAGRRPTYIRGNTPGRDLGAAVDAATAARSSTAVSRHTSRTAVGSTRAPPSACTCRRMHSSSPILPR